MADQVRNNEQGEAGNGAAMAAALLPEQHCRHTAEEPRLREAGGGLRHPRPARRAQGGGAAGDRAGDGAPRASGHRLPREVRRELLPDGAARRVAVRDDRQPGPRYRARACPERSRREGGRLMSIWSKITPHTIIALVEDKPG